MTDLIDAGSSEPGADSIIQAPADTPRDMGATAAARLLASIRHKRTEQEPTQERQELAASQEAQPESAERQDAGTQETEPTSEATETQPDTAETPPIEPPRSWTAEAKERFAALPRDTQEYLRAREEERDRDISRRQSEVAEQRKAIETERGKAEQARQQYESMLPQLAATLQQQQAGQFSDIKTIEDVTRLAQTDWPRYVMWDAHQKQVAAVQQEVERANQRQAQEKQQKLAEFFQTEATKLTERMPELNDPAKRSELQGKAVEMLHEIGFNDDDLGKMWRGEKEISLHDHRLQLLIRDGLRYREANAKPKPVPKNLPPVQRPGAVQSRSVTADAEVKNLAQRLDATGNVKDAARFLVARRAARPN